MTKKPFIASVKEDLNRPHNVTLSEGQISTILYIMEGYLQGSDDNEDTQFTNDCDNIFKELEGVVDNMSEKDLVRYAREQLIAYHNEDSLECLKEDIDNYDEELFDELVDNVISNPTPVINNQGGQS